MNLFIRRLFWFGWNSWIFLSILVCLLRFFFSTLPVFFLPEWISPSSHPLEPPSYLHWWGTDELGRDVFIRLLFGTGYSLVFSITVAIGTAFFGLSFGILLSLVRPQWKAWVTLCLEVVSTLPLFPLILLGLAFYPGQIAVIGAIKIALGWGPLAQLTRAESDLFKNQLVVTAAKSQGLSKPSILLRYFLPNLSFIALSFFPLLIFSNLFTLATLDYFGLGFPIPTPNLAEFFRQFQNYPEAWWLFVFPITLISSLLLGLHQIGKRRH